jgi:hypothetical protein
VKLWQKGRTERVPLSWSEVPDLRVQSFKLVIFLSFPLGFPIPLRMREVQIGRQIA